MSSIGSGYDNACTTFSPEGKIFQVDYAVKAVDNSGSPCARLTRRMAIAIRCVDGVVFGTEKLVPSKMMEPGSNRHIFTPAPHVGIACAGLLPDGKALAKQASKEANSFKKGYGVEIPVKVLADRLALHMQNYTLYAALRPFGCSLLVGGHDGAGYSLHYVEPSGLTYVRAARLTRRGTWRTASERRARSARTSSRSSRSRR